MYSPLIPRFLKRISLILFDGSSRKVNEKGREEIRDAFISFISIVCGSSMIDYFSGDISTIQLIYHYHKQQSNP